MTPDLDHWNVSAPLEASDTTLNSLDAEIERRVCSIAAADPAALWQAQTQLGAEGPSERKRTVAVLDAMLRGGLAAALLSVRQEGMQAEFDVAHAQDALDGAFAQLFCQREDIGRHCP